MTTTTTSGLSTSELADIRAAVEAGRQPKVMFTDQAGQIAGQVGQVVRLTDPAASDEWLVVRFGRDELPFSPTDLTVPPKGRAGKGGGSARATSGRSAGGTSGGSSVDNRSAGQTGTAASEPAAEAAGSDGGRASAPQPAGDAAAGAGTREAAGRGGGQAAGGGPSRREDGRQGRKAGSSRGGRSKAPAALTVTLAYEAGEWTVAAHQGSKTLAKPYLIRPAEALKMVGMLDVPGVQEAVEQIVNTEVAEARQRAETLRSELAEVEARLAELRTAGGDAG